MNEESDGMIEQIYLSTKAIEKVIGDNARTAERVDLARDIANIQNGVEEMRALLILIAKKMGVHV